jgi:hypothetical protein
MQRVSVRVTVEDFSESFWVDPVPGEPYVGTVANALMNGAVSYGDVVEWNGDGQVVAVRARSDRATLICGVDIDPEDLVLQAKWEQACKDARRTWGERGVVVESGFGTVLIASFVVQRNVNLMQQCADLIKTLPHEDWNLACEVGPFPGSPTDAQTLGLRVPAPDEDDWEDEGPDPSGLPDISGNLLADCAERDLIARLKSRGYIHAELDDREVLAAATFLLKTDYLCYQSCQAGRNDQVLVVAGELLSLNKGLMLLEPDLDVYATDFLGDRDGAV